MTAQSELCFRTVDVGRHPERLPPIHQLLSACGLEADSGVSCFVEACCGDRVVGCAGLDANIVKCVAVEAGQRGDNLSARLLAEVEKVAAGRGYFHLFLYTRPACGELFQQCGFWPIVRSANAVLMENTPLGIAHYCRTLRQQFRPGRQIAAIVMNANPFTLGHRWLAQQAASRCDWLHVFVVHEDASCFTFRDRLALVQAGLADLPNVTVHEGSQYILSRATFPAYFLKDAQHATRAWCDIDLLIFRDYIVPTLGITHRFIGSEPFCDVTRQYNQAIHRLLGSVIDVVEMKRKCVDRRAISASEVRRLLQVHDFSRLRKIVPETTFSWLKANYRPGPV